MELILTLEIRWGLQHYFPSLLFFCKIIAEWFDSTNACMWDWSSTDCGASSQIQCRHWNKYGIATCNTLNLFKFINTNIRMVGQLWWSHVKVDTWILFICWLKSKQILVSKIRYSITVPDALCVSSVHTLQWVSSETLVEWYFHPTCGGLKASNILCTFHLTTPKSRVVQCYSTTL